MKGRIKKIAACMLFLAIFAWSAEKASYLFGNTGYDRLHIIGMYEEGPLDVAYIGGSSAFTYWQPFKAWNDCGFTSYSYATNSMPGDAVLGCIQEILRTHRPQLFVADARIFQGISEGVYEPAIRNCADAMDLFSVSRWRMVHDYLGNRNVTEDVDVGSHYFTLAKYHTNIANLASPLAWEYVGNRAQCPNKGWEWLDYWSVLPEPAGFETEEHAVLDERKSAALTKLLEFCKSEGLEVLFTVSPYAITQEAEAAYHTMQDMVESYGYRLINTNDYYREMGIDFSRDFYNGAHTNLFGAEKYTKFLEDYMKETYSLPDHRKEDAYASWHEEYARYAEEEAQHRENVASMIAHAKEGKGIAARMRKSDDLLEWAALAEDPRFLLLLSEQGSVEQPTQAVEAKLLKRWGFAGDEKNGIRVVANVSVVYTNAADGLTAYTGTYTNIGYRDPMEYTVRSEGGVSSIQVGGEEYSLGRDGINAVVLDGNYLEVIDSVNITNKNGKFVLSREP